MLTDEELLSLETPSLEERRVEELLASLRVIREHLALMVCETKIGLRPDDGEVQRAASAVRATSQAVQRALAQSLGPVTSIMDAHLRREERPEQLPDALLRGPLNQDRDPFLRALAAAIRDWHRTWPREGRARTTIKENGGVRKLPGPRPIRKVPRLSGVQRSTVSSLLEMLLGRSAGKRALARLDAMKPDAVTGRDSAGRRTPAGRCGPVPAILAVAVADLDIKASTLAGIVAKLPPIAPG